MMPGGPVLLWLAIVILSDSALAAEQYAAEQSLIRIAGERAARCGSFRRPPVSMFGPLELSREESRAVSQCITAAYRQKRGFFFSVESPGADLFVAAGLVGEASGAIKRFQYRQSCRPRRDDEPGPGAKCDQVFETTACPPPKAGRAIDPGMTCR
jgi:hypothetical protein